MAGRNLGDPDSRAEFVRRSRAGDKSDIFASYPDRKTVLVPEVHMRRLLVVLLATSRRLTGTGALDNAAGEVRRATLSTADLDAQLDRVLELPPRRAA